MRAPNVFTVQNIVNSASAVKRCLPDGRWVPARPDGWWGLHGIRLRFRGAWLVFTGRADAVTWEE